jgi:hypothetical protein
VSDTSGKRLTDLAMDVLREGKEGREMELATDCLLMRGEIQRLKAAIRKHRDERGNDRCWLDDRELYAVLGEGQPDTTLPPQVEFLNNCLRFHTSRQAPLQRSSAPVRAPDPQHSILDDIIASVVFAVPEEDKRGRERANAWADKGRDELKRMRARLAELEQPS